MVGAYRHVWRYFNFWFGPRLSHKAGDRAYGHLGGD